MSHLSDNLQKFSFVPADASHYEPLADFLIRSKGFEDHIRFLLSDLLKPADSQKIIHVNLMALLLGEVAGFAYLLLFPDFYCWRGLAVDPKFMKLEVVRYLLEVIEKIALQHNVSIMRMAATTPSIIPVLKKLKYAEIRHWHIWGYKLSLVKTAGPKSVSVREAVDSDLQNLEKFLSESSYYNFCDRMYAEDLIWYPLGSAWLKDLIKRGKVLLSEDGSGIRGLAIINKKSLIEPFVAGEFPVAEIGYLDGSQAAILDFVHQNYHPSFLRIYSAGDLPLNWLPVGVRNGCLANSRSLFRGLNLLELSDETLFFMPVIIMQKTISNHD